MGYGTQLKALFYKNLILCKRCIKMHLLFLIVFPLLTSVSAILREKNGLDIGKAKPESAKWEEPADPIEAAGANFTYVVVDMVSPQQEDVNSPTYKIARDFLGKLKHAFGNSLEKAVDSNEGVVFHSNDVFDDHYLKLYRDKKCRIGGAITLNAIKKSEEDNVTELDLTIQHNGLGKCVMELMRFVSTSLSTNLAANTLIVRKRMHLSNDETMVTVMAGDPSITAILCASILPLILFIQLIMSEKEERIYLLMRLNGLHISSYYFTQAFWFTLLYLIPFSFLFPTFAFLEKFRILSAQGAILASYLILNGIQLATLSVLLCSTFKRLTSALPIAIGLSSMLPITVQCVSLLKLPEFTLFIPLFGYAQGFLTVVYTDRSFVQLMALPQIWKPLVGISVNCIVFLLLAIYLGNVIDQNNSGITRPWHFLVSDLFSSGNSKPLKKKSSQATEPDMIDEDVKAEIDAIEKNPDILKTSALAFTHVSKQFKDGKLAVEDVSFTLESNQIFGLLGPNGAGKSTLMQIAGGMYYPSTGKVFISGISSSENPNLYYKSVGYCPQHDIYWKDLTVSEHLKFFEMLRGSKGAQLDKRVKKGMACVRLTSYAKALASRISGGERRRLSLAMSLSGDSMVVLLDEPTTGLDPKVRRMIWDIIGESRAGRLIILTTHSMEEAELLSQKLTIMAHGRLRCFGTPDHLKQKFGGQIFINVSCISGQLKNVVNGVKGLLPEDTSISIVHESSDGANARLLFNGSKLDLLQLMMPLLENKTKIGLESFGVNQSSLDDVFMNIVKEADADA